MVGRRCDVARTPAPSGKTLGNDRRPPHPKEQRQLVLHVWQHDASVLRDPNRHRDIAVSFLHSHRRWGISKPGISEFSPGTWLVYARHALLGIQLHGYRDGAPYDPGLPLGSVQVSERIDLDFRYRVVVPDARNVVFRSG